MPLLCILVAATALADAPRIVIDARGVPAGDNLIANSSFEEAAGEWPAAWSFTVNQPTKLTRFWAEEAHSGARSAGVRSEAGYASGYWTQNVPIEPAADYLLTARVQIEDGKVLVRAHGMDADGEFIKLFDRRAYDERRATHIMAPVFWRPAWIVDMVREAWAPVDLVFTTRGEPVPASVSVQIGSYFHPGTLFIDDVYLGPGTLTLSYRVEGAPLARVRLLDADGNELAGGDPAGAAEFAGVTEDLPLIGPYCVEAAAADGTVVREWYPEAPEGVR